MVRITGNASKEEAREYVKLLEEKYNRKLESLECIVEGEYVDLRYKFEPVCFERIRRITGYLVGDTSRWNNSKRAEEADRVKHDAGDMEQL